MSIFIQTSGWIIDVTKINCIDMRAEGPVTIHYSDGERVKISREDAMQLTEEMAEFGRQGLLKVTNYLTRQRSEQ